MDQHFSALNKQLGKSEVKFPRDVNVLTDIVLTTADKKWVDFIIMIMIIIIVIIIIIIVLTIYQWFSRRKI